MDCNGAIPINCFALVTYIPGALGAFLDELRRDLVPSCIPRAHVTVLPPRALPGPADLAVAELDSEIREVPAFEVEACSIEMFEPTKVIYIGLGAGRSRLEVVHNTLNTGRVYQNEAYTYHPHITLAQDFDRSKVEEIRTEAVRRWAEYRGPRAFTAESMTFVQNTDRNRWLDLAHWTLNSVPAPR